MLARYWRIYIATTYANIHAGLSEIEMRGAAAGPDLTGSGTAISIGDYSGSFLNSNAFDDNTSSDWVSPNGAGDGSWIGYDFGSDVEILEVDILPRSSATTQGPKDFAVQSSSDGISWTGLKGYTATTWGSGVSQTFTVPENPEHPSVIIHSAGVQRLYKPQNPTVTVHTFGVQILRAIEDVVVEDSRRRNIALLF